MQDAKTGDNLMLLRTDMGSSYFGATDFEDQNRRVALDYAFFRTALGLAEMPAATTTQPVAARRLDSAQPE